MAAEDQERDEAPERPDKEPGTGRALLWTAASVPLPGLAHLRTGRKFAGTVILGAYLAGIAALAFWVVNLGAHESGAASALTSTVLTGQWLLYAMGVVFAVTVLWLAVIVHSWVIVRPRGQRPWGRGLLSGAVVLLLCLPIGVPSAYALHAGYTARATLSDVFNAPERPDLPPHDDADPWDGAEEINVLLLGADSADDRHGVRTDTMMVANIDTETGDAVLIGLPRNLEDVQFPEDSELAERYPEPTGFDQLLNDVYEVVSEEPDELAINPTASDPAADALKYVIGHNLDLDIGYYTMVDMMGFRDMIDAVGGVEVYIEEDIPYGVHGGVLEEGLQELDGHDALWYGRSRIGTDDYGRMGRQGCLVKYMAEQMDPSTVLTSYQDLAGATQRTLSTDIPQSKVSAFIDLANLVTDEGDMSALQLSPPQVSTYNPDWDEVQELVADAIENGGNDSDELPEDSEEPTEESTEDEEATEDPEGEESADGTEDEGTEWQDYTGLDEPSPADPGRQVGADPTDLDAICP